MRTARWNGAVRVERQRKDPGGRCPGAEISQPEAEKKSSIFGETEEQPGGLETYLGNGLDKMM